MHLAGSRAIDVVAKRQQQPDHDKMQLKAILNHVEKQKGFVYSAIRFDENKSAILIDIKHEMHLGGLQAGDVRCVAGEPVFDDKQLELGMLPANTLDQPASGIPLAIVLRVPVATEILSIKEPFLPFARALYFPKQIRERIVDRIDVDAIEDLAHLRITGDTVDPEGLFDLQFALMLLVGEHRGFFGSKHGEGSHAVRRQRVRVAAWEHLREQSWQRPW